MEQYDIHPRRNFLIFCAAVHLAGFFAAIVTDYLDNFLDDDTNKYVYFACLPLVAMHWEHRFNCMVRRYNDIFRVQMPNITTHVCRHTYCSNRARAGMNPKTLQYLMGCCVPFGTR